MIAENARSTVLTSPFVTSLLTITSVGGPKAPYLPSVARILDASALPSRLLFGAAMT